MTEKSYIKRGGLLFTALIILLTASCARRPLFPTELKLERVLYQTGEQHPVGPGGINHTFTVYKLSQEVSETISAKGLPYLNSLSSVVEQNKNIITRTSTGPYRAPFAIWNATPISKEEKWLRYGRDLGKDWQPSITTFFVSFQGDNTKDSFISTISPEFADAFNEAISTPGNYYAYGYYRDMCLLVVSPKTGKAFYLFRD